MLSSRERGMPALVVGGLLEAAKRHFPALAGRGMSQFVEDYTKPLLVGYVRRDLLVTDGQVSQLEREMTRFALAGGYSMGFAYVEKPETWPAAFEALIESVNRYEITAVVVPSMLHFAVLDTSRDVRQIFEQTTGARVLALAPP